MQIYWCVLGMSSCHPAQEIPPASLQHHQENIVSFVNNDGDKLGLRKVCRHTCAAPCLQPSGVVIDLAKDLDAMDALTMWPTDIPLKSLTIHSIRAVDIIQG